MMRIPLLLSAVMFFASACTAQTVGQPSITLTGRALVVNGTREVPRGLFGIHATSLTPEQLDDWGVESVRLIHGGPSTQPSVPGKGGASKYPAVKFVLDCFYDRYQPALVLTDPVGWEPKLVALARGYAVNARTTGVEHHVEFWNEPYLNWATRPGVNYDGQLYDESRAVEGGPVHYRGSDEPIPHLVWRKGTRAVDERGNTNAVAWGYAPRDGKPGDAYDFRGKKYKLVEAWMVRDTSQRSFYSGQHNLSLYLRMLRAFAPALKQANPDVKLAAGWDFHLFQDNWRAWHELHKPTIDASIEWIDGYTEHHYGGDTRSVAVSYEVANAYSVARHNKRLLMYNTEAGGLLDPQRPDSPKPNPRDAPDVLTSARGAMTYFLRDVIYLLQHCPDKAFTRYAHEAHLTGGDELAFKLLKPLRGTLLEVNSSDPNLYAVASLNDAGEICLVVFNDSDVKQVPRFHVAPPRGTSIRDGQAAEPREKDGRLTLTMSEMASEGERIDFDWVIPARSAVRFRFALRGEARPARLETRQHFAPEVLMRVEPGQTLTLRLDLPADELRNLDHAWLKLALPVELPAGAKVLLNDLPLEIAAGQALLLVPLDSSRLKPTNQLQLVASEQPLAVDMLSVVLGKSDEK
jgi:hypothetical protein